MKIRLASNLREPFVSRISIKANRHPGMPICFGRGTKTRTLDTRFWRPLLYQLSYTPKWCMFDSAVRIYSESSHAGAGDGNRTRTASLEGWNSTIELHPQNQRLIIVSHGRVHVKHFLIFLPPFPAEPTHRSPFTSGSYSSRTSRYRRVSARRW